MALRRRNIRFTGIALLVVSLLYAWDLHRYEIPQTAITFIPDPHFRGILNLFVQSGEPLMKFEVDLDTGKTISRLNEGKNPNPPLTNQCWQQSNHRQITLSSPDGAFFISCDLTDSMTVKRADGSILVSHVFAPGSGIYSEQWAPDSSAIVVLAAHSEGDFSFPRGILRLFSGHPIELTTYRLFLFSPEDKHVKELPILPHPIEGAWAAVGWPK